MALYVDTDYWVEGYAEGDVVAEEFEPRVIQLPASLSTYPTITATPTAIPGYDAALTLHTSYAAE